ncbi:hypothetical protein RB653_006392 [Dictyostelium firmibasis]|uniref:Uncharacterized protein n=1 Tax=Dictyostelium firmibasis TaxID=79012 RepID=A0AAN7UEF3_9MYCE
MSLFKSLASSTLSNSSMTFNDNITNQNDNNNSSLFFNNSVSRWSPTIIWRGQGGRNRVVF